MDVHLFARCTRPGLSEGIGGRIHKRLQRAVKKPVEKRASMKVEMGSLGQAAACLLVYKRTTILVAKPGSKKIKLCRSERIFTQERSLLDKSGKTTIPLSVTLEQPGRREVSTLTATAIKLAAFQMFLNSGY